jgi:phosphoserine phosphatase
VLSGDREAIAKLSVHDLEMIAAATLAGMSVDDFYAEVKKWLETARPPRWKRPYTKLTYLPMQEVLKYMRANGYKTYIVTGGGQDCVCVFRARLWHPARASTAAPAVRRSATTRQAIPDQGTQAPARRRPRR